MRVVVDCANGAGYRVAPEALWELGAEVFSLGVEPDGFNISKDVGSTAPSALPRKVAEMRADIGIALDGDAYRVAVVDEKGQGGGRRSAPRRGGAERLEDRSLAKLTGPRPTMSGLGLERHLKGGPPRARAHPGRRPLRARTHARGRASISAASRPAISSCRITRPRETASSRPSRCSPW